MMRAVQQGGAFLDLRTGCCDRKANRVIKFSSVSSARSLNSKINVRHRVSFEKSVKNSFLSTDDAKLFSSSLTEFRKRVTPLLCNQPHAEYDVVERLNQNNGHPSGSIPEGKLKVIGGHFDELHPISATKELTTLALPAIVGQALDPFAQLLETAFIGRLGLVELASAGVSVSIFNIISKLFNVPLLSITTSFVAEDVSKYASNQSISGENSREEYFEYEKIPHDHVEKLKLPSVSTALLLAAVIGTVEALALFMGAGIFLGIMGVSPASPMRRPAQQFLSLRALGAPAVVVSLAIQGVFRGFKDTKTPVFCVGLGNLSSIVLLPILAYSFHLGITGAAFATIASQYITTFLLIWYLSKRTVILPPKIENLRFGGYLKSGGLLLGRTLSVLITMTLGTSMAARLGPLAMAAHQICFQIWMAVSLLSDALALSAQALIASSFAKCDYKRVKKITYCVLKTGLLAGIALAAVIFISFGNLAKLFTNDVEVLNIVRTGVLFVSSTQPINALAFIFDGLHYGVSDFAYAAYSMITIGVMSSVFLLHAHYFGLGGVWCGLTLFMTLRMTAGIMRLCWKSGPWWFLQPDKARSQPSDGFDSGLPVATESMEIDYAITNE